MREFASVVERAVILGMGKKLNVKGALNIPNGADISTGAVMTTGTFPTFDKMAENHIREALLLSGGGKIDGKNGAANLLGLHVSTLRGKMRKYGIIV